ncbi:ATP-binding cassette domain-containing protein [Streptomyces paradoxus]|uniref:ATP-binding cassette domain-containing protein n=1 Tax=Streptomyces paradoxus TaxID=66375 RepID=UPI0037D56098
MTTTEHPETTPPPRDPRDWLAAAAVPGHRPLRLAAACQVLETVFTIAQWTALAWIVSAALRHRTQPAWTQAGLLLLGGVLAAGATWGAARFQAVGHRRTTAAVRGRLVAGLLPGGGRRAETDAATAAMASVELADDVADHHAQVLPQRLSAAGSMAVVFGVTAAVQWPAAVVLLLASLLIPLNLRLAGLLAKEGAEERVAAATRLGAVVLDSFRGLPTLRGIGALTRRRSELAGAAAELDATTMEIVRRAFVSGAVMDVVVTFSIAADATYIGLSLLGYVHIAAAPRVTLFTGLLTLLLCPMYFQPLRSLAAAHHSRERAAAAAPTLMRLAADPPSRRPGPLVAAPGCAVLLDDVTFRFPHAERRVLGRTNAAFAAGSWTAVTGPSGVGKTTLLSLIAGAREPSTGTVRWETGAGFSPPHLGACAWIGQQTVLLPGSIGDNIRIARPSASPADIDRAVAAAGLAEVVARLPHGLNTRLGEGGRGMSTGEARRIAIARALLRDAGLWILDEPTAHLDADAEALVVDVLRTATRGRTVVVATHSLALAQCAETVFTLGDGTLRTVREATPA